MLVSKKVVCLQQGKNKKIDTVVISNYLVIPKERNSRMKILRSTE